MRERARGREGTEVDVRPAFALVPRLLSRENQRDWYCIAEKPAPAPHLAHPEGCAALRIVVVSVPRVSRSCVHFPDGFDLHLLRGNHSE